MKPAFTPVYFDPDANPDWNLNPGVLTAVNDMYPTKRGTLRAYSGGNWLGNFTDDPITYPQTSGTVLFGRAMRDYLGTSRIIMGTTKRLYKNNGNLWSDISKGATDYTTASDWTFAVWGNQYIACSKENAVQTSNVGGTFADLGGAPPKARLCATQKDFLLLADCNDGTNYPDMVAWSGLANLTAWNTSINDLATQAGYNRLRDTPGPIKALIPLRDAVIAYKEDSIYVGTYTGRSPFFWEWQVVSHAIGCSSPHGVSVIGDAHYFIHATGIYRFDGSSPQLLSSSPSRYLKTGGYKLDTIHAAADEQEGLILWYLKTSSTTTLPLVAGLGYNLYSKNLGWIANPWGAYLPTAVIAGSYSDFTAAGVTAPTTSQMSIMPAFSTTYLGYPITAVSYINVTGTTCAVTTGDIGSDFSYTKVQRVTPVCIALSSLSDSTGYTKSILSGSLDSGTTMVADTTKKRYDFLKAGRWHRMTLNMSGAELAGINVTSTSAGEE